MNKPGFSLKKRRPRNMKREEDLGWRQMALIYKPF
jgi:hypothetical protein